MKKCPNGHVVGDNMKFCPQCGATMMGVKFCKNCGAKLNYGDLTCPHCGFRLDVINKKPNSSVVSNNVLVLILSAFILVLLCMGVWLYKDGKKMPNNYHADAIPKDTDSAIVVEFVDSVAVDTATIDYDYYAQIDEPTSDNSYNYDKPQQSSRTFANEQYVYMYLANQRFHNSSGVDIKIDGDGRIYIDGDAAGVISVLRYDSKSALLRYGNGMNGEGKILVRIVSDKLELTDPVDGTTWYQ
ncbi:MAG: hypothetical protein IJ614_03080 [Prevotella sp.]|nr:hypothetical protein [Prevotella sp.]